LIDEIRSKFDIIRRSYSQDVKEHFDGKDNEIQYLEKQRKDLYDFIQSYCKSISLIADGGADHLKEGLEQVIQRFYNDEDLTKYFAETFDAIPKIKAGPENKYEIRLNNKPLDKLVWR